MILEYELRMHFTDRLLPGVSTYEDAEKSARSRDHRELTEHPRREALFGRFREERARGLWSHLEDRPPSVMLR